MKFFILKVMSVSMKFQFCLQQSLLTNILKQNSNQPSFFHIDSTFKVIDLRFPVVHMSTETLQHNYRPICFFITESETTEKISKMMQLLIEFMKTSFSYDLKPKSVLRNNTNQNLRTLPTHLTNWQTEISPRMGKQLPTVFQKYC